MAIAAQTSPHLNIDLNAHAIALLRQIAAAQSVLVECYPQFVSLFEEIIEILSHDNSSRHKKKQSIAPEIRDWIENAVKETGVEILWGSLLKQAKQAEIRRCETGRKRNK